MERRAQAAEALVASSQGQDALDSAIRAAELYMSAAAEAATKSEGARLRRKCQDLIGYAERLKSGLAPRLSHEETILRDASRLHGNTFPPWQLGPSEAEFQLPSSGDLYEDDAPFTLSRTQAETFAGWKRPKELFAGVASVNNGAGGVDEDPEDPEDTCFIIREGICDLVQDVTTDCSVVAGLSAAINVLIGKHSILSSIFYPFDYTRGRPRYSAPGKYVMRLNFNGCCRRVVIDDRLPASLTERTLFVVDRINKRLLWPALLEKAYLKVRGGYDFPGSNSGTDLWVLTGWIPEQVFLQRDDLDINQVWARIKAAHDAQDVVITIGTGCISPEEEAATGLVGEHDYAVQGVNHDGDRRLLLIKNPWCNGPVWTGGWQSPSQASFVGNSPSISSGAPESATEGGVSGALWVTLEDVAQNFESMYLNWNPQLFPHRTDRHFSWVMPPKYLAASLVENPQFSIVSPSGGLVWILISRHFQDAELEIAKRRTDSMAAASRQLGFMSILVFDSKGKSVQVAGEETYCGPYVDTPHTLARLDTTAGKSYTVVLDQHEFPLEKYSLTLSTFSYNPLQVQEASRPMLYSKEELGSWNRRNAGGRAACTTYFSNPQYRLVVPSETPLSILLSADDCDIHIQVDLVWGHGRRVTTARNKDMVATSGEYRRGCAVADIPLVEPGTYTLVCSTFEAGQLAKFGIRLGSMVPITLETIPADAAGRLRTPLSPCSLSEKVNGIRATLHVHWLTRATASVHASGSPNSSLLLRLSIVHGRGPNQTTVAVSGDGEFQSSIIALRTAEFDMEPERVRAQGMWVVIEGMGVHNAHSIVCELFSDSPVQVGAWEVI